MYTLKDLGLGNDEIGANSTEGVSMLLRIMYVELAMRPELTRATTTLKTHIDRMTEDQSCIATHDFALYEDELMTLSKHVYITAAKSIALGDPQILLDEIIGTMFVAYVLGYTDGTRYAR